MAVAIKRARSDGEVEHLIRLVCGDSLSHDDLVFGSSEKALCAKRVAAALLSEHFPPRDWGRIEDRLECSHSFIVTAASMANDALKQDSGFHELYSCIKDWKKPPPDSHPAIVTTKEESESPVEMLIRLTDIAFNVNSQTDGNVRKRQQKLASQAKAYIARWGLKKSTQEAAKIAGVVITTFHATLRDAHDEYACRDNFYEKVNSICDELKIERP